MLVTELRGPSGLVQITDALAPGAGADLSDDAGGGRCELVRSVAVPARVGAPAGGTGAAWGGQARAMASGLEVRSLQRRGARLHLRSSFVR